MLPFYVKTEVDNPKKFKAVLQKYLHVQKYLHENSFYSLDEYFELHSQNLTYDSELTHEDFGTHAFSLITSLCYKYTCIYPTTICNKR